ncbi:hypothetical protein [Amycolatopsis sp. H20-H5]|nr:hypothetical protein [Amycolatopsis sp. H20-H5]MEC3981819.1 hypothetical protein [Amycolatopsis sp. H20-H5]
MTETTSTAARITVPMVTAKLTWVRAVSEDIAAGTLTWEAYFQA